MVSFGNHISDCVRIAFANCKFWLDIVHITCRLPRSTVSLILQGVSWNHIVPMAFRRMFDAKLSLIWDSRLTLTIPPKMGASYTLGSFQPSQKPFFYYCIPIKIAMSLVLLKNAALW